MPERTLLSVLSKLPPAFCRYVARTENGRRGYTTKELQERSGLSGTTIKELSFRLDWNDITVSTAQKFLTACGVNPLAARKHRDFARRRKMIHVANARGAHKKLYDKIEVLFVEASKQRNK